MGSEMCIRDRAMPMCMGRSLMKEKARVSYSSQTHNRMDFAPKTTYSFTFKGIEKCYEYALIPTKRNRVCVSRVVALCCDCVWSIVVTSKI